MADTWFRVNGREYARPRRPVVVVCLDGCEPDYLRAAVRAGRMPALKRAMEQGISVTAKSVIPSFTNPNNLSIATGRPPSVHGICGNYFLDPEENRAVMMNEPRFLRAPTVFAAAQQAGARVAVVTAKDKLRALLGAGLDMTSGSAMCFSAERAAETVISEHGLQDAAAWLGRPQPDVYSADLSEFVFAAGAGLLREFRPDLMYLTTTDYIQHKFAPDSEEAIAFHSMFDRYFAELDELGALIAVTADHGMKPKHDAAGRPQVVYAQEILDRRLGVGQARVILPITDPYVVHHGALGSFATVYLPQGADPAAVIGWLADADGIEAVLPAGEACGEFELPPDRIGDLVILSDSGHTIGTTRDGHDLAALDAPLRSHGGLSEQMVPFIMNRGCDLSDRQPLRNFDALCVALRAASDAG